MTLIEKLKAMFEQEWRVTLEDGDGYADRGDFNCPHRKQYDPKDGHGVSQLWAEKETLEENVDSLYEQSLKVIPGEPYETTT